jgi:site-specific DNA-methyltransferase (adenine-specific)/modification methylase
MLEINKIYNQYCLEGLKKLPDKSVDMVLTSPPYNMRTRIREGQYTVRENSEHFSKKYKYFGDDLPIEEYYYFHKDVLTELLRVSKIVCYNYQIVTGSKEAFFRLLGDFSPYIKDIMIWNKGAGQPAMHEKVLNSSYEFVVILEGDDKKGRVINNSYFGRGMQSNVISGFHKQNNISGHGACFPVDFAKKIITLFSKEGDLILDPFMGSGTTAVAAKELGRKYIGFEIVEEYVKFAEERLKKEVDEPIESLW